MDDDKPRYVATDGNIGFVRRKSSESVTITEVMK